VASHDQNDDVDITPTPRLDRRGAFSASRRSWISSLATRPANRPEGGLRPSRGCVLSQLTEWRRARDAGTLGARKSGRSAAENREIEKLTKKNQRLEDELERTRLALDIVEKHTLSWKVSPRERTTSSRRRDPGLGARDAHRSRGRQEVVCVTGSGSLDLLRRRNPKIAKEPAPRPSPPNALSAPERVAVLALLSEPAHCDLAVDQVYARALDEGIYLCSPATMHRLLADSGSSSERRASAPTRRRSDPSCSRRAPMRLELDITKLHGPTRASSTTST